MEANTHTPSDIEKFFVVSGTFQFLCESGLY